MKKVWLSILMCLLFWEIFTQIPNGSFEQWEQVNNYEKPVLWETNQSMSFSRFEKDTLSVDGQFSLKIIPGPNSAWSYCESRAEMGVNLHSPVGENRVLTFYVLSIPDTSNSSDDIFLSVQGEFYEYVYFDSDFEWTTYDRIDGYTKIEIPIQNPNVDSLIIRIKGGAKGAPDDGCESRSISWIDNLQIESDSLCSTLFLEDRSSGISIFPNPTTGILQVFQESTRATKYKIYTMEGVFLKSGNLSNSIVDLREIPKGMKLIILTSEDESYYHVTRIFVM